LKIIPVYLIELDRMKIAQMASQFKREMAGDSTQSQSRVIPAGDSTQSPPRIIPEARFEVQEGHL